jgi:iron complex outermembrane recepter protein
MAACIRRTFAVLALFGSLTTTAPLWAQESAALQEVVVTAQKRAENLQQTPVSMAAINSDEVLRLGITNVASLTNAVPDLHIMPFGSASTTLEVFIRGVGQVDSQVTEDSPVGIYLNGVYIARPVGLGTDIADIDRIEVLRGPQGTLYGRNTTGGAINILTTKPQDTFGASELVTAGNYGAWRSQTILNLPVTDTLAVRGVFDWNKRDGWLTNNGLGEDFSAYNQQSGRFDMRWHPSEAIDVDYSYDRSKNVYTSDYYHLTEPSPNFAFLPAQPDRLGQTTLPNPFMDSNDLIWGHTLTVTIGTPIGEVKSISAYRETHSYNYQDFSANTFLAIYRNDPIIISQHQVSEELQLVGSTPSKQFDYIAGLYYFKEGANSDDTDKVDIASVDVHNFVSANNQTYAAYGQLTWRPTAQSPWAVTVGARYTKDKREADNLVAAPGSTEYDNTSPTFILAYQPTSALNFYGKVVQGYKAGGFNWREGNFNDPFGPEKITTYELGAKTEWLEHRLRWNVAVFYSDYKDMQLDILVPNQPDPTLTRTENAGKAKVSGVETEFTFALLQNLRVNLNYAYLHNEITEVEGDNPDLWHLPGAPKNSVFVGADWDIAHTAIGLLSANASYSYRSESLTQAREVIGDGATAPSYSLVDLRVSLSGNGCITAKTECLLAGWVRNLTDSQWQADPFGSFSGLHAIKMTNYGTPRTFGVDFRVKF